MYFHIDFSLYCHLIIEHTINKLQFALTVIELSPLYVQRPRFFYIFLDAYSLLVAFSEVEKSFAVF